MRGRRLPPHLKTKRYPKSLILSNVYLSELNSLESVKRVRLATFERNYVWHFLDPLTLIWSHASNNTALRPSFRETVTHRNKLRKINLFHIRGLSGATIFQFGLQEHKKALTWKFRWTVRKNRPKGWGWTTFEWNKGNKQPFPLERCSASFPEPIPNVRMSK